MTVFARDANTGMAKWVYQMTPHDEWDYDGVNEMILADIEVKGQQNKLLVHFDRNGFGYTMDRVSGDLLVAEKYDPAVNWATHVDMQTGRPQVVPRYSTDHNGSDVNTTGVCPAALGTKDQQPALLRQKTGLFYVPTNHVCMDYEPFKVSYTAGQPYVGATLSMYPAPGGNNLGNFIAWDAAQGKIVWSNPEPFSVWSGALSTAGDLVFYGTLEGYLKAVDPRRSRALPLQDALGHHRQRQHVHPRRQAVRRRAVGRRRLGRHRPRGGPDRAHRGPGCGGRLPCARSYTQLGGELTVFGLPD